MEAQKWLEINYPDKEKTTLIEAYHNEVEIDGDLFIEDFPDLKTIIFTKPHQGLNISDKGLNKLKVNNCPKLERIICVNYNLNSLEIKNSLNLTVIKCGSNNLTELDLKECKSLKELHCQNNKLTNLDLSNNSELRILDCQTNKLNSLDLDSNKKLDYLACNNNNITNLNLKENSELTGLSCPAVKISDLDVSNNHKLNRLDCFPNDNLELSRVKISERITDFGGYPMTFLIPKGEEEFKKCRDKIWKELVGKLKRENCEMELIDISDLDEIVKQTNSKSIKEKLFFTKFVKMADGRLFENFFLKKPIDLLSLRILLDNLSNQILARCLIVGNRLWTGKEDRVYEKDIYNKSIGWQLCGSMNPKYGLAISDRKKLVNKAIQNQNQEIYSPISDLSFILKKNNNWLIFLPFIIALLIFAVSMAYVVKRNEEENKNS